MPTTDPSGGPPIRLEQVSYRIAGQVILDRVDLTVYPHEIFAVMGRSGTGKTTLLRLIMGLLRPARGRILIDGADISRLGERELDRVRVKMGFVFQDAALFDSLTVAENVAIGLVEHHLLPPAQAAGRVRALLELVDVAGAGQRLPAELSGGMRKRVGIARALAMEPSLVLYDEPTAGLDPIYAAAIDNLIVDLRDRTGVTSMVVSHDVESLRRISDRVALLHAGRFLAVGPLAELERSDDAAVQQFLSGNPEGPLTDEASDRAE